MFGKINLKDIEISSYNFLKFLASHPSYKKFLVGNETLSLKSFIHTNSCTFSYNYVSVF